MKYLKKFENSQELEEHQDLGSHYMFFKNIESIKHYINEIEQLDQKEIGNLLDNGHDWAADHITVATDCIEQVSNFLRNEENMHMDQVDDTDLENTIQPEVINNVDDDIVESYLSFLENIEVEDLDKISSEIKKNIDLVPSDQLSVISPEIIKNAKSGNIKNLTKGALIVLATLILQSCSSVHYEHCSGLKQMLYRTGKSVKFPKKFQ
jgi:hypothetical protein